MFSFGCGYISLLTTAGKSSLPINPMQQCLTHIPAGLLQEVGLITAERMTTSCDRAVVMVTTAGNDLAFCLLVHSTSGIYTHHMLRCTNCSLVGP